MLEVAQGVAGIALGLAWIGLWAGLLHLVGLGPIWQTTEVDGNRRERLKRLGQSMYIVIFGVLGPGVAFGVAITSIDFIGHLSRGWAIELTKFVFLALIFGLFQGFATWRRTFRSPVPFPPDYPSPK